MHDVEPAHALSEADFALARRLIAQYAGIKLSEHKRFMVYNRLVKRLRALGLDDFGEYLRIVQTDPGAERMAFVNALTTNLTAFFREPHHFELLAQRARLHAADRPLRAWSCACSTGEEPWSMAITLSDAGVRAQVLASDIDTDALARAEAGVYPAERAEPLAPAQLRKHFLRGTGDNEGWISVRPELRATVSFRQVNLQSTRWPPLEPFDAIFCRNVAIYFDRAAQMALLARLGAVLRPGGLLCVGHAESFPAAHPAFRGCGRTAYEYHPV